MASHGMAARRLVACAALVFLAPAGCSDVLSNVEPGNEEKSETGTRGMGPFGGADGEAPSQALSASTDCPNRCALPMKERPNMPAGTAQMFEVDEVARLLGNGSSAPFTWRNASGAVELGIPEGYGGRMASGLNNWGQTAGYVTIDGVEKYAAAWEPDGTPVVLRSSRGGPPVPGEALAISDSSVIVGRTTDGRAFRSHWRTGFRYLGEAGTAAHDVDWHARAVGYYTSASGTRRPALWAADGTLTDLGTLPGHTGGQAVAISPRTGIVVGVSTGGGAERGWIWTADEGMKPLPEGFKPKDVNAYGEVAGWSGGTDWPNAVCAVWWHGYGLRPLPLTPGASGCEAHSINSWGDVAGFTESVEQDGRHLIIVRAPVVWTWASKKYRYGF
jgi:uncharacterized membrane protein